MSKMSACLADGRKEETQGTPIDDVRAILSAPDPEAWHQCSWADRIELPGTRVQQDFRGSGGRAVVYLGNSTAASQSDWLKKHRIKRILNCAGNMKVSEKHRKTYASHGIEVMSMTGLLDREDCPIFPFFAEGIRFIQESVEAGKPLLVNCQQGMSRSASILAAYLIEKHDMSLVEALFHLRRMRGIVHPNRGFLRDLIKFDIQKRGKTSIPYEVLDEELVGDSEAIERLRKESNKPTEAVLEESGKAPTGSKSSTSTQQTVAEADLGHRRSDLGQAKPQETKPGMPAAAEAAGCCDTQRPKSLLKDARPPV
uniref:protein-tyrosine-phosphatase n=1 Tax=Chromera velia CCMP2878 TaxID=1169474 RepID=A0A0G4I7F9_9ALVE|eukprot:Cvel_11616.t1-p1 / transcript=Cvel_11616.t1 / gene=Cvel_11616 / organism=Chromera_velia_CCMP2878 / gene_product=Dual specificity protein phosphatase 1, putative / transcript_product=Dual specificity protein phosphatase 1, putative / location=Cvel_scaffold735:56995-57927(-) / protein_length=311 / sequence_SO=supercontig / SO=protein_coding / is_pseudo=false